MRSPESVQRPVPGDGPLGPADTRPFRSILFPGGSRAIRPPKDADFIHDLNLDQVIDSVAAGRQEYRIRPFFTLPLHDVATVTYRQEIFRDLSGRAVAGVVELFEGEMRRVRSCLEAARSVHHELQRQWWFLEAGAVYCAAVPALWRDLGGATVRSRGLRLLRAYLSDYVASSAFTDLREDTDRVREGLSRVRYTVHIKGAHVTVDHCHGEADYGAEVLATFERFRQAERAPREANPSRAGEMSHVEARVLDLVAQLNPGAFGALARYGTEHRDFVDVVVGDFDREVQFYLAYLDHVAPLEEAGLALCYPLVGRSKAVEGRQVFDLALAGRLVAEGGTVVCNDFQLVGPERVVVVTGPNQGGKTTFARTVGQLFHLAALGCPVPGTCVRLALPDRVLTHFARKENLSDLRGQLEDDLIRVHQMLERASSESVLILNEIFTSTTLEDARLLGERVLRRIIALDCLAVYVTFVDELSDLSPSTVSMVSAVRPEDPTERTYRLERRRADGLAYAAALAQKYGLGYEALRARVAR
ncbi:MutS-like protein [Georgenia muralis]|uniref:MutS-like protein n=1 Tax=Georgenia muralis TaxID=154117 RepID=A0A3N4Z3Y3_9MICO|nr:MutS-like protein [Georgenia muralis]